VRQAAGKKGELHYVQSLSYDSNGIGAFVKNILIVHSYHYEFPLRKTTSAYLFSFKRYANARCFYWNAFLWSMPSFLKKVPWDAVIFTDLFAMERWLPTTWPNVVKNVDWIKDLSCPKALIPQDEYIHTDQLNQLIRTLGISHLFSCANAQDVRKIYAEIDWTKVSYKQVLTGYIDERFVDELEKHQGPQPPRDLDITYRTKRISPSLGRKGVIKSNIAGVVETAARERGLNTDISLDKNKVILGKKWFAFLQRSRWTIGTEGGSGILDHDGSLLPRVEAYVARYPSASFEEIEAIFFPSRDGEINLFAITPRNFEACVAKTGQILIRGDYNGILRAGEHYLPIEPDFSNLSEVLEQSKDENLRLRMVDNTYRDIVMSGKYGYDGFVRTVLGELPLNNTSRQNSAYEYLAWYLVRTLENLCWFVIALYRSLGVLVARATRRTR